MGPDQVVADSTSVSVVIRIMDSTDGTPETGVEHNTAGIDLWYRREGAAVVSITEVALAALTTAYTSGGIEHISHGYYRLDVPDTAFADGADGVQIGGTVTGMIVYGPYIRITNPVNAFYEPITLGTSNSTTQIKLPGLSAHADDELNGELLIFEDISESEYFPVYITDWANTGAVATIAPALPATPPDSTDRVWRTGIKRDSAVAIPEAYSTDGSDANPSQLLYELVALLSEFATSGTTVTVKKRDGSTTAMTLTLSDATNPTSITRAT